MRYWIILTFYAYTSLSMAQDLEGQTLRPSIDVGTSIVSYDNVFNAESNHDTDTSVDVNAATSVSQYGHYYSVDLSYSTYKRTYLQDSYEDQNGTIGEGRITLGSASSPLQWNISNTEQQTRREVVSTDTPDNRNQRSVVSTGPQLNLRLSEVDSLLISADYRSTTLENSNADTKSDSVNVSWDHRIGLLSNIVLRANYRDMAPKSDTANNFIQVGYSANYNYQLKEGLLSINVGESTVDGFRGLDDFKSETYMLRVNKKLGTAAFTLSFSQDLSNNSLGNANIFEYPDIGRSDELDIEKRRSSFISYNYPALFANTALTLSASETNSISQTVNADDRMRRGTFLLTRPLPKQFTTSLEYRYSENNSINNGVFTSQFFNRIALSIEKRINERFSTNCQLQATSSSGRIVYDASTVGCNLGYRLL